MKKVIFPMHFFLFIFVCCFSSLFASEDIQQIVRPYLMPQHHPLKAELDKLFTKTRVLRDQKSLVAAGFGKAEPRGRSKVIVTRHRNMPGYIFKLYTDDRLSYYRNEPEYVTWALRARGAYLIRQEIKAQGWEAFFKAPKKWIYQLPLTKKADPGHLQKNFILVEEEMDLLPDATVKKKWRDGTVTVPLLEKLFFLVTKLGLQGACKHDNIPLCRDGKIAFIDTQNNLCWPIHYERLYRTLDEKLKKHWDALIQTQSTIPRNSLLSSLLDHMRFCEPAPLESPHQSKARYALS